MRLETSLELGDEWKLTVLCVMNFHIHCGLASKESACSVEDLGSITRLGRSPGEGKGCSLQCSGLENSLDCIVHGVAKSWMLLSDFHWWLRRKRICLHPGDLGSIPGLGRSP